METSSPKVNNDNILYHIFLFNPTVEIFNLIKDKEFMLMTLKGLPDTVEKLYFLWSIDHTLVSREDVVKAALRDGNSEIFLEVIKDYFESHKFHHNAYVLLCIRYNRMKELEYFINQGYNDWEFILIMAIQANNTKLIERSPERLDKRALYAKYHKYIDMFNDSNKTKVSKDRVINNWNKTAEEVLYGDDYNDVMDSKGVVVRKTLYSEDVKLVRRIMAPKKKGILPRVKEFITM